MDRFNVAVEVVQNAGDLLRQCRLPRIRKKLPVAGSADEGTEQLRKYRI